MNDEMIPMTISYEKYDKGEEPSCVIACGDEVKCVQSTALKIRNDVAGKLKIG